MLNGRDGGTSDNDQRAGHCPPDVLEVSRYYPDSINRVVVERQQRFQLTWQRDRVWNLQNCFKRITVTMYPDDAIGRLLRTGACVDCDDEALAAIRRTCAAQIHWEEAIRRAERHGLAPWLGERIAASGADIPLDARRKLKGLTLRHEQSNRIRAGALVEILDALTDRGVQALVLKGAALAHLIYDRPALRPMADIDILVAPDRLDVAAGVLGELGYAEKGVQDLLAGHHHLPTMSRRIDGLLVSIEIHHEAIAFDNIGSIRMGSLSEPAREFPVDGAAALTLGHIDMLRHLCRHALEPRETVKLGSVLDIMLYATRFAEDIDWPRFRTQFPGIITNLQLFGYLVPWPGALGRHILPPSQPAPAGVGIGMAPLSNLRRAPDRLARLLNPSDWWLHAFYDVPPGRSLAFTRIVRHPARLAFWLWRRTGKVIS